MSLIVKDAEEWFETFNRSKNGNLSQKELLEGLYLSLQIYTNKEKEKIKQSIENTWSFYSNDSTTITKQEFCKTGGLSEAIIAMEEVSDNQEQKVRVAIPNNVTSGDKIKIRAPMNSELVTVTIPNESQWKKSTLENKDQLYFDVKIPISKPSSPELPAYSDFYSFQHSESYDYPTNSTKIPYKIPSKNIKPNGRRKALLIGINYKNTNAELASSTNDVKSMKKLLMQQGFATDTSHMVTLVDDETYNERTDVPTKSNIQKGLDWLVHNTIPGDVLFFHFSGHGAQITDLDGDEEDGLDETILPSDYITNGEIVDDELFARLVYKLPSGVRLTAVMDCCHSGTGLDLSYQFLLSEHKWKQSSTTHAQGHAVLFAACEDLDGETAQQILDKYQKGGAMTNAFVKAYDETGMMPFVKFLDLLSFDLQAQGFSQKPQLSSTQQMTFEKFSITHGIILGNQNEFIGMKHNNERLSHSNDWNANKRDYARKKSSVEFNSILYPDSTKK